VVFQNGIGNDAVIQALLDVLPIVRYLVSAKLHDNFNFIRHLFWTSETALYKQFFAT